MVTNDSANFINTGRFLLPVKDNLSRAVTLCHWVEKQVQIFSIIGHYPLTTGGALKDDTHL